MAKVSEANVRRFIEIHQRLAAGDRPEACFVAPAPHLRDKMRATLRELATMAGVGGEGALGFTRHKRLGFNDGLNVPGTEFRLGTTSRAARNRALERAHLAGAVRVLVVLVDFPDKRMSAPAKKVQRFEELFFARAAGANSVRNYFREVTNGKVDIIGEVVGPLMMPQPITHYANGESATGDSEPNGRTLGRDAAILAASAVDFGPYDNDADGYVEAFVIVHAGHGAEQTGDANDIWSHKWIVAGQAVADGAAKVYAYLTVPEDARLGVCAHELGHLVFGFPDLYDTTDRSEGVGNWCLMGAGSWLGGGDKPAHPSAWCKAQQGWVNVKNITANGPISIRPVQSSNEVVRLWRRGKLNTAEYFLVEHRKKKNYDEKLPGEGLLIWHIDDAMDDNDNRYHPKVRLVQADDLYELENRKNQGNASDPYPGSLGIAAWGPDTAPDSESYSGIETDVALTEIGASGAAIRALAQVGVAPARVKKAKRTKKAAKKTMRKRAPARKQARRKSARR